MRKQHVLQFCYGLAIILHRMTGLICKILFKSNIKGKKKEHKSVPLMSLMLTLNRFSSDIGR